jgi:hypothetical protein
MDIDTCTVADQVLDSKNITPSTAYVEVNDDLVEQISLKGKNT